MSVESGDVTSESRDIGEVARAMFEAGRRVSVEQVGVVHDRMGTHCMGFGELLAAPLPGGPLELRIRGARGLASSRIRETRAPLPGYLLVATERSVYLVALPELQNTAHPESVEQEAIAMVRAIAGEAAASDDFTQYVRLSVAADTGAMELGCGPCFASIERSDANAAQALGQCELLSAVVEGSPLRLATADGRVLATSEVVSITRGEAGEYCVATANSVYVLAPIGAPEAAA